MSDIPDQRPIWNDKHGKGDHEELRHTPSPLAALAEPYFPRASYILELGCGVGRDAEYFAGHHHTVLATDGAETVISQNREQFSDQSIRFEMLDIRQPMPYDADSFDVVYANLALHYYSDQTTKAIMAEIKRVLKPVGIIAFACKSYDSMHNEGVELEKNVFASPSGATIHLFSLEYTKSILEGLFDVQYIDEIEEEFKGRTAKIVRCIAASKESKGAA